MKPIEPGCQAIIINSKYGNNGKSVQVIEATGRIHVVHNDTMWKIDKKIKCAVMNVDPNTGEPKFGNIFFSDEVSEYYLMRIDDPDLEETQQSHEYVPDYVE